MKHHRHAIGWKRANYKDHAPLWRNLLAYLVCSLVAIALTVGCVCVLVAEK